MHLVNVKLNDILSVTRRFYIDKIVNIPATYYVAGPFACYIFLGCERPATFDVAGPNPCFVLLVLSIHNYIERGLIL